ncbi:MAG: AAA family ATPase [Candidatus Heimdallarchaeota archaeon]|nr:AAA family ATPase [Candidatus Heimdallarchaeota archaeon]
MLRLKKVSIRNFKSFRKATINLSGFNVLVGSNSSGKTNFIELFKLLRNLFVDPKVPSRPFQDWWNYENIVWNKDTTLPIEIQLDFSLSRQDSLSNQHSNEKNYDLIKYKITFNGNTNTGSLNIIEEILEISNYLTLTKDDGYLRVRYAVPFFNKNQKRFDSAGNIKKHAKDYSLSSRISSSSNLIKLLLPSKETRLVEDKLTLLKWREEFQGKPLSLFSPLVKDKGIFLDSFPKAYENKTLFLIVLQSLQEFFKKIIILKSLDIEALKKPVLPRDEDLLDERGENFQSILYRDFLKELPERIKNGLENLFPKTQLSFKLTADSRIFMRVFEGSFGSSVELHPPSISDGFYKSIIVLTALEQDASIIAIDEIENSLHAKTLEYLLDELKESASPVIITTHSPTVVDMIALQDLIVVEKTVEGSILKRIKNVEKIREKLQEQGITHSESWLYGNFGEEG